jgi:hypothetical protein
MPGKWSWMRKYRPGSGSRKWLGFKNKIAYIYFSYIWQNFVSHGRKDEIFRPGTGGV